MPLVLVYMLSSEWRKERKSGGQSPKFGVYPQKVDCTMIWKGLAVTVAGTWRALKRVPTPPVPKPDLAVGIGIRQVSYLEIEAPVSSSWRLAHAYCRLGASAARTAAVASRSGAAAWRRCPRLAAPCRCCSQECCCTCCVAFAHLLPSILSFDSRKGRARISASVTRPRQPASRRGAEPRTRLLQVVFSEDQNCRLSLWSTWSECTLPAFGFVGGFLSALCFMPYPRLQGLSRSPGEGSPHHHVRPW